VRRQVLFHQRSGNVLLHEFAHQLDNRDGSMDGTPLFDDPATRRRWIDLCTGIWHRMQIEPHPVLDRYGATNPAEFYAVAVETFFVRPTALAEHEPELFELLVLHLRQDPRPSTM
jgi:Mlc titration factor MtfA (ptsG expression regulator)